MQNLEAKTALITGGASGIGFALARALLAEGANVVIADVDQAALDAAIPQLQASDAKVMGVKFDVTNRQEFARVADEIEAEMGPVHILCNNAGVHRGGGLDAVAYDDWDWVLGVNIGGVVNGLQTFIKRMLAHGEEGHIVNTASMAGMVTGPGLGVYSASKFAVVGLTEALRLDLARTKIGVSVLCPGMVSTNIFESERNRPDQFATEDEGANAAASEHTEVMKMLAAATGIAPDDVARCVIEGIKNDKFYLFPHPELKASAVEKSEEVLASFGEPDPARLAAQAELMAYIQGQQG